MKLLDIMQKDSIIPTLASATQKDTLRELIDPLAQQDQKINKDDLLKVLLEREELGSTGIGDGIAIPHGKLRGINKLLVSFGRSPQGIDFQAMDGQSVYLFFLLVAPENSAGIHLKALARIARLLKDTAFRKKLLEAESRESLFQIIADEDNKH